MYIKKYPLFKLHAFQSLIKKNKYFIRKTISVIVVKCMYGNVIPVIIHGVPLEIVVHLFISFLKEKKSSTQCLSSNISRIFDRNK